MYFLLTENSLSHPSSVTMMSHFANRWIQSSIILSEPLRSILSSGFSPQQRHDDLLKRLPIPDAGKPRLSD